MQKLQIGGTSVGSAGRPGKCSSKLTATLPVPSCHLVSSGGGERDMLTSGPFRRFNASTMLNYGIAILAVAVALAGGLLLQATIAVTPSVSLFLCAIMFAAWIGGT